MLIASKTNILQKQNFQRSIIKWYQQHKRALPWRENTNAYQIWLSEIILQQTRVAQGLPYYLRFIKAFPAVQNLAKAPQEQVLKLWEGLGYYSRARNMHFAANQVVNDFNGNFPTDYKNLLGLKGVGSYTAAAIASFAFNLPHAVLDGNVYRVLARLFNISTPINTPKAQKEFSALANELLLKGNPAEYNQSIMEFGALQCVPNNPDCTVCPLGQMCLAYKNDTVRTLPIKKKAVAKRNRYFYYLQLLYKDATAVQLRGAKDIWQGLYQFPLFEFNTPQEIKHVLNEAQKQGLLTGNFTMEFSKTLKPHLLSHQKLWATVLNININSPQKPLLKEGEWVNKTRLLELPMPVLLRNYLDENQLPLAL